MCTKFKTAVLIITAVMIAVTIAGCSTVQSLFDSALDKISGGKISEKLNAVTGMWSVDSMIINGHRLTAEELNALLGDAYYDFRPDKTVLLNSPIKPAVGEWKIRGDGYVLTMDDKEIEFKPENDKILLVNGGVFTELSRAENAFPMPQMDTESTIKPSPTPDAAQSQNAAV